MRDAASLNTKSCTLQRDNNRGEGGGDSEVKWATVCRMLIVPPWGANDGF